MKKLLLTFLLIINIAYSNDYLTADEVVLNKGAAFYTVVKGTKVERFNIELLSLIEDINVGKMILFKVEDSRLLLSGGVAEGMSGSPVYQNGKFIGAIAYGLEENASYGLILAADNLDKFDYDFSGEKYRGKSVIITPVRGDISIDAIGTLTLGNENGDVYVYAHNLENKGNIKYFLYEAQVEAVIPTKKLAFKMGDKFKELGYIDKDTKYGLKGHMGMENININNYSVLLKADGNIIKEFNFEMINDKSTKEVYFEKALDILLNRGYKHSGYKSAKYTMKVYDEDNKIIFMDKDFLVGNDNIKISLANTLYNRLIHFTENKYKSIKYKKIDIEINLFEEEKIIYINNIDILGNVFLLGDKLKITFDGYIHQDKAVKIIENIEIPNDFPLGSLKLNLILDNSEVEEKSEDMKSYIKNLTNKTKNNEISVQFVNQFNKIIYETKIEWDYYLIPEIGNFSKDIVIDSFEASN